MNDLQRSYDLLQLKPGATPEEVKRAFREQVAAWHPDRFSADPAMQRRAGERLRLVIEAHRSIAACHGGRAAGSGEGPVLPGDGRRGTPVSVGTFFRTVPNLVFCAAVMGCALLAGARHGMTIHAWNYGVEIALVPTLFSLAYNLAARNSTAVRNLYLGFSLCALAVVAVDGAMVGVERSAPAAVQGAYNPGGYDGGAVGSNWPSPRGGGMDDVFDALPAEPHGPSAVRAPAVPLAPAAPAAPLAPAAPVVPLAR